MSADDDLLAVMRGQYRYATLKDHMLADGVLHLRCGICRVNPVPHNAGSVLWCDPCLDELLSFEGRGSLDEFIARKRGDSR